MNWRAVFKKILRWGAVSVGILIVCIVLLFGIVQTEIGRNGLIAIVERTADGGNHKVEIGKITGVVPFSFKLDRMSLADEHGALFNLSGLEFEWNPWSMIKGDIHVRKIRCSFFHLENIPSDKKEGAAPTPLPQWLAVFTRLRIDHLAVDELVLSESVVGERATFRLQSDLKAALAGGEWITHLVLDRTDGPEASLRINASIRENGQFLLLDAEGHEAPEGLLARRAAIPGPFVFSLRGEGPLKEWKGGVEMNAGGAGLLKAQILASYSDGIRMDLDGFAEPEREFLSEFLGETPGGRILFKVRGGIGGDGQLYIEHLSFQSGEADLNLSGSSDLKEETLNARFRFRHGDLKEIEKGVGLPIGGTLVVDGEVSGTIRNPSAVLSVDAAGLRVERASVSGFSGEIQVGLATDEKGKDATLRFKGNGLMKGLSVRDMERFPERDLQWGLSGERFPSGNILLQGLTLRGEKNSLQISGKIDPATGDGAFDLDADARELSLLLRGTGLDLPGNILLKGDLGGNFKTLSISGNLQGRLRSEDGGQRAEGRGQRAEDRKTGDRSQETGDRKQEPEIRGQKSEGGGQESGAEWLVPLLAKGVDVSAKISLDQGQKLSIPQMLLKNPLMMLSVSGTLDLKNRKGSSNTRLKIHDLAPLTAMADDIVLGGSLEASAAIDGSMEKFTLSAEIHGQEIRAGMVHLGPVQLELKAAGKPQANDGSFRFEAGEKHGTVSGEGRFSLKGERISLTKVQLSGPGNTRAKGNLDFNLVTNFAEGALAGECPDLSEFSGFLDRPLNGKVDFNAELGKGGRNQHLNLVFSGVGLKVPGFEAGEVRIKAKLTEFSGIPKGNASLESKSLHMQGIHVTSLGITTEGDGKEISFRTKVKGEVDRRLDLESEGVFHPVREEGAVLRVTRFKGNYGELPFRTAKTLEIRQSAGVISAEDLHLVLGSGRLSGRGKIGSEEVDLSIRLEELPLHLIIPSGKPSMEGSASGEVELKGRVEQPEGNTKVRITGIRGHDPQLKGLPPAVLEADAEMRGQRLKLELLLRGVTAKPFITNMDLPLRFSLHPFHASLPEDQPVSGELSGRADLTRLGGFFGMYDQTMSGIAEVDLHLEGTPSRPKVKGTIGVEKGGYENARSGTLLKDVNILLIAGTRGLVIERATATDGEEGRAAAEGWLEIDPERDFPFQVGATFEKLKILRHDWVTARGKGRAQLKGSFSGAVLSGDVEIDTGELRIPERLPPDIPELEVTEINHPDPKSPNSSEKKEEPDDPFLDFNLRLKSAGHFFVRGHGLDSEWGGELKLTGTSDEPAITGDLSVERGRFNFLDKRFTLTEGRITFNGMAHPSPFLDVMAQSNAKDMTAHLRLVGPLRAPEIKLSSEPPLPADEVLSRLLFGQSMNRISPLQAIQLAQTLNAMRGGKTLDLLGATRKLLKIDQLEVKQSGENGDQTSIAAGKYLGDNVYFEVEQGIGPGGTKASVEWELSPHISVETEIGANAESGVGINWKWDY